MKLPELRSGGGKRESELVGFGGVNYAASAREGELSESQGLSSRAWPYLTQRLGREKVRRAGRPNGLFAWGELCMVDGTSLLYGGKEVGTVEDGAKEWAVVNTKLCIFPDRKYLDLESMKFGSLDERVTAAEGTDVVFSTNSITLQADEVVTSQEQLFPSYFIGYDVNPSVGVQTMNTYIKIYDSVDWDEATGQWVLTGEQEVKIHGAKGKKVMLRRNPVQGSYQLNEKTIYQEGSKYTAWDWHDYTESDDEGYYAIITGVQDEDESSAWQQLFWTVRVCYEVHYARHENEALEGRFVPGDRVDVTGCTVTPGNNVEKLKVKGVSGRTITFEGTPFTAGKEKGGVTITRPVPALQFICESDNRLWGCEGHTLWASALGDPTHFYDYDGLSTDSYTVAVGTPGEFTGCCPYSGSVLFWKEERLHKVLGSYPAEYQVCVYDITGLQAGSHKSLTTINEVLYYKGRDGVYTYTGGTPTLVSAALGERRFTQAAAESDGRRYMISMYEPAREQWGLYTYDTLQGLWLREDDTHAVELAELDGAVYLLDAGKGALWRTGAENGEAVEWSAQLHPFYDATLERKRHLRLYLRLELGEGATAAVELKEDDLPWRRVWHTGATARTTFQIPLRPRRCDKLTLRLSGKGECLVRALGRELETGSRVR